MVCIFCQEHDVANNLVVYGRCNLSDGQPCIPCAQYVELEAQICETKRILEKQLSQQRELRTNINRVHDRTVLRFPVEITSLIFQHSLPISWTTDLRRSNKFRKHELCAPLRIGAVCRAWRQIAWSTPQLWNFVYLKVTHSRNINAVILELLGEWMSRTGYLPLSIRLSIYPGRQPWEGLHEILTPHLRNLINLVNSYSNRWQNLAITCASQLLKLFDGNSQGAPILRVLELSASSRPNDDDDDDDDDDEDYFFRVNGTKPRPKCVSLKLYDFTAIHIDWSDVTDLTAKKCPVYECLELLAYTPKLETYRIIDIEADLDGRTPSDRISSETLRSLELLSSGISTDSQAVSNVLNTLSLPGLVHFSFQVRDGEDLCDVVDFLERSSCTLESLSLHTIRIHDAEIINLLRGIPSLEKLELIPWNNHDPSTLFRYFGDTSSIADPDDPGFFLPKLKKFKYQVNGDPDEFDGSLLSVLVGPLSEQRRPLNSLTFDQSDGLLACSKKIFFDKGTNEDIVRGLLELDSAGVLLNVPVKISRDFLLSLL